MGKLKCLLSNFVFFVIPLIFLTSCGLDTYIVVDGPTNVINPPSYTTEDYNNECFEFWTNDSGVASYPSEFEYLGTQVYYKIYGSSSTLALASSTFSVTFSVTFSFTLFIMLAVEILISGFSNVPPTFTSKPTLSITLPALPGTS